MLEAFLQELTFLTNDNMMEGLAFIFADKEVQ